MSDTAKSPAPSSTAEGLVAAKFNERELQLLGWAMQSLKSGPPEIDNEKLANFAGMTNPRSAGNAWNALKKKLMAPADSNAPPTPKRGGRKKKEDVGEDGEDGEATPKKTSRKRSNKEPEEGDASPKKKGRATKAKPKQESEDEGSKIKAGSESAEELKPEAEAEEEV